MHCYECSQTGIAKEAIGICHHCSAGLCGGHVYVEADPITLESSFAPTVVLPKVPRLLLCKTCKEALHQSHLRKTT